MPEPASGTSPAAVRMFGALQLRIRETVLGPRDLGSTKAKQLFEILLLERGRTVTKDRIADRLWGDQLPQRVAATVEGYVSVLRGRLGIAGLIRTDRGGYRLSPGHVSTDVDRFGVLLRRAAATSSVERRAALESATAMAADDLLADEPEADWVRAERTHYRAAHVQALVELAECCLALSDPQSAIASASRALALEPTRERGARAAMLAHYTRATASPRPPAPPAPG